jgi:glutathione S-transferase
MIKLYQYNKHWGINASPFCLKIEKTLEVFKLPFESSDPFRETNEVEKVTLPKGKLPYIADDGKVISDSEFILDYLYIKYGKSLNDNITKYEKAVAYAFKKMIEEHLYWVLVYSRWFDEENWNKFTKEAYFGDLPQNVAQMIIDKTKRDFIGTGIGIHSQEEIYALGMKDMEAINALVENKKGEFIFGSFSEIDVILYSFLIQIKLPPHSSPLKDFLLANPKLLSYINFLENFDFLNGKKK